MWIVFRSDTGAIVAELDSEEQAQEYVGTSDQPLVWLPVPGTRRTPPRRRRRRKAPAKRTYAEAIVRPGQTAELYLEQHGRCAICHRPEMEVGRLHLDHNHVTGRVRGLLCRDCNWGIGWLRSDHGPAVLESALAYTIKYHVVTSG